MTPIYINKGDKSWYCISIFYAREEWATLIKDIVSFYTQNTASIDTCLIFISTFKGERINITFSSDIGKFSMIEKKINAHFKLFLKNKPSTRINNYSGETMIWSDYPNNTLVWNRYEIGFKETEISQSLTFLFTYLLDDDLSVDNTFSVALFLSVKLVKCINPEKRLEVLNWCWNKLDEHYKTTLATEITKKNYNNVLETISDYWKFEFDDNQSIALLNQWTFDVQKILSNYDIEEAYKIVLYKICWHLSESSATINYFIIEWYAAHCNQIE